MFVFNSNLLIPRQTSNFRVLVCMESFAEEYAPNKCFTNHPDDLHLFYNDGNEIPTIGGKSEGAVVGRSKEREGRGGVRHKLRPLPMLIWHT